MAMLRMACAAMATRFELVLHGPECRRLRALGEEAVGEIERIEAARRCVGWDGIDLDPDRHTIGFRGMVVEAGGGVRFPNMTLGA
ncbi:MAG: hypothetical protein KF833_06350 [Verrucomicrobiae bacterium]|nr:hypothetical protein [Verrucomicrobiae bacterium]